MRIDREPITHGCTYDNQIAVWPEDLDELEAENEELREVLQGIISCIENPRVSYQQAQDYIYKVSQEAVGDV